MIIAGEKPEHGEGCVGDASGHWVTLRRWFIWAISRCWALIIIWASLIASGLRPRSISFWAIAIAPWWWLIIEVIHSASNDGPLSAWIVFSVAPSTIPAMCIPLWSMGFSWLGASGTPHCASNPFIVRISAC